MFYAPYRAEILSVSRVTRTKPNFINHCLTLLFKMIKQGGNINIDSKTLPKTFSIPFETFIKFFAISLKYAESIFIAVGW